jgi:hypothetical protein
VIGQFSSTAWWSLELRDSFGNELVWLVSLSCGASDGNGLPFRRVHQVPVVIQPIQDFSRGNDLQRQRVLAKSKVVCIMLLGS